MPMFLEHIWQSIATYFAGGRHPMDYASLFQLAVALNLVMSGYAEMRVAAEERIEAKIEAAGQKIRSILSHLRRQCVERRIEHDAVIEQEQWNKSFEEFAKHYFGPRIDRRRADRTLVARLLTCAAFSLLCLLLTSSLSPNLKIPNGLLLLAVSILYVYPAVGVFRTIVDLRRLEEPWDLAKKFSKEASETFNEHLVPLWHKNAWTDAYSQEFGRPPPQTKSVPTSADSPQTSAEVVAAERRQQVMRSGKRT